MTTEQPEAANTQTAAAAAGSKTKNKEEDNVGDCSSLLAEYEDRFKDIDSTLEELRSSFVEVSREDCVDKEGAISDGNEEEDNEEEEEEKTTASASMSTLKATLAEQSAAEMEKIVQKLKED